mmetsp:Transcript_32472/g.52327  ORF Transcript_32472/g.52327 Transcript_32472/m.52327 type:complete len:147 (+) Transcript_32472:117-557(+)
MILEEKDKRDPAHQRGDLSRIITPAHSTGTSAAVVLQAPVPRVLPVVPAYWIEAYLSGCSACRTEGCKVSELGALGLKDQVSEARELQARGVGHGWQGRGLEVRALQRHGLGGLQDRGFEGRELVGRELKGQPHPGRQGGPAFPPE